MSKTEQSLRIQAPELTLPPDEARAVREAYHKSNIILEYGSGGSTVLAAGIPGTTIYSVESDAEWALGISEWLKYHPPAGEVIIHTVNIGPTKRWGIPVNEDEWKEYYNYPISVWDRPDFRHPDTILIDGRFRSACFVTAVLRISKPVTVLWDDYSGRKSYHEVERLVKPIAMHGRMAEFEISPMQLDGKYLRWFMKQFTRVL